MFCAGAPIAVIMAVAAGAAEAGRMALVVGNAQYDTVYPLKNAAKDARDVADRLRGLGFDVTLLTDVAAADFETALETFANRAEAEQADTTLFYFSGHAFQLDGANYLVPRDAQLTSAEAIASQTWRLDEIVARLEDFDRSTLVFLDACRNNPLPLNSRGNSGNGLAELKAGSNTYVAFATQPDNVTADGAGDNSPFTEALLQEMSVPGISISDMMIRVRNSVEQATFRTQTPWDQSSLRSQFYFQPVSGGGSTLTQADYEMLATMAPEMRDRMLSLMQTGGIAVDKGQVDDVVVARQVAALNVEILPDTPQDVAGTSQESEGFQIVGLTQGQLITLIDQKRDAQEEEGGLFEITSVDVATLLGIAPDQVAQAPAVQRDPQTENLLASLDLAALGPSRRVEIASGAPLVDWQAPDPDDLAAAGLLSSEQGETLEGRALAAAVQGELARLGCYRMAVDGDFGRGSRLALVRYYGTKQIVGDTLEPSNALLGVLRSEPKVVCELSEIKDQRVARVTQSVREVREEREATVRRVQIDRMRGQNSDSGETTRPIGIGISGIGR